MPGDIRIIFRGDEFAGKKLIRQALVQMDRLDEYMSFNQLEVGRMERRPSFGVVITARRTHGLGELDIYVAPGGGAEKKSSRNCLCNCKFSHGYVLDAREEPWYGAEWVYDVLACFSKREYRLIRNVLASDFTKYTVGQKVIVIPYNNSSFSCCDSPSGATGCSPTKSKKEFADPLWRTTCRIIPWCGELLPKWINVRSADG